MPMPVEKREQRCISCCCSCRYRHPLRCPRCGSHELWHRVDFLGCWFCGLWAFELCEVNKRKVWQPLPFEQVHVRYARKVALNCRGEHGGQWRGGYMPIDEFLER